MNPLSFACSLVACSVSWGAGASDIPSERMRAVYDEVRTPYKYGVVIPWDAEYAHKPWLLKHNGVVYHFCCAVGSQGRAIALATSRPMKESQR